MKKIMHEKYTLSMFRALVMICCICIFNHPAKAETPKMISLAKGKVYRQYDITGDRKRDAIQIINNYYGTRAVVNGRTVFQRNYRYEYLEKAYLVVLKNGKKFIYIQVNAGSDYSSSSFLLQYKSGRLVNVLAPSTDIWPQKSRSWWFTLKKVKGNSVVIEIAARNPSMSWISAEITYKYKNNRFQLSSRTANVRYYPNKSLKASRNLQLYKSATSGKKAGVLKKGQIGRVKKVYLGKKNIRFYVVGNNGKKGWFNSLKSPRYNGWRIDRDFEGLAEAS